MASAVAREGRVRLWDAPIRVIHWSLVLLLPALWWTAENGQTERHTWLGYVMLGLLLFRLLRGFAGGSTARFAGFVRGPRAVLAYLSKLCGEEGEPAVGHNPLGGWSVLALLGLLILQVGLGLISQDVDGIESGPLSYLVSYETADGAREWHGWLFNLLLALVALHLGAILFYLLVKRDNLIGPMISGHRRMPAPAAPPTFAPAWRIALGAALATVIVWWVSRGAPV